MKIKILQNLFNAFNDDFKRFDLYYDKLKDLNNDELACVVDKAIVTCRTLPSIAEILDLHYEESFNTALNTLKNVASFFNFNCQCVAFEDDALAELIRRKGLRHFAYSDADYFSNYWNIKNLKDEYIQIAKSSNKKAIRHIENKCFNAICLFYDKKGNKHILKNIEELQLFLRDDKSKQEYLAECKNKENLKNILVKVIV